ncbi:aspartyl/glutamyl-tRNA(Asn/Gln) amidotransferase subunit A [Hypnocyclicus thermotrophus]|uniref:Glutamyl-tRNA(Gln) amidotransferase subunit A n=1 Tax=Hypnocyclicus thermotrophus TaxID=1627895 RepID=A0AA46DZW7_9FUSO|nr:Asp-tRNA(Asn)/Glu-tRNA(Gln) amidotransferase subunit GatA [Hypnocyclicus thermotrophus]TDT72244.1 aspartyl/glutamyl-tRNA(Asn/Gln) amidotransferase subunit A [Hypnocyclicus thermotrophus]
MDIFEMSAIEIREAIINKKISAIDLINKIYEKIEKEDKQINSFITLSKELAKKQAEEIDDKIKNGESLGKLAGIPIAIKDNICTDGIKTTCASKMLEDFIPPYDATVIKKLKAEDAIIIGKVNMDEFAMGSSCENSYFGPTKNPVDISRVPGGSSGGSSASVAAKFVPISLGSDTGGSIRQPAGFCGVTGLKPTYGKVSRFGLIAFGSSLDQIGPITRSIDDAALCLEVIQGHDKLDNTSAKLKYDTYLDKLNNVDIQNMKIAVAKEFIKKGLNEEIKNNFLETIEKFKSLGAKVEYISMPITEEGLSAYYIISSAEASSNLARFDGIRYGYRTKTYEDVNDIMVNSRTEAFGKEVKRRIMLGTYALSSGYYDAYYNRALKLKKKIKDQYKEIFEKYDLILSPISPVLPFKIGEKTSDPLEMYLADIYTININLAGVPAISIPSGKNKDGLPIGIQLIGKHFDEEKILRAAKAFEGVK